VPVRPVLAANRTQLLFCGTSVLTAHQTAHKRRARFVNPGAFDRKKKRRGRFVKNPDSHKRDNEFCI
jgi:hypothetical protein